jgi:hypothetical protein
MSFDLYVWKAPVPRSAEEADDMLRRFYERDPDFFVRDPALRQFRDDLLRAYPALEEQDLAVLEADPNPTWAMTPPASDRCVELNFTWHAPDVALTDAVELAQKYGLVMYDPQGPDVHSPAGIPRSLR